ncbi:MAG: hypothetical protein BGN93_02270 [Acinetobacter sp. 39-4]|nr:MAG: hypothetical protein BGN93_02270 [Acinetobacter sp. 39-4]
MPTKKMTALAVSKHELGHWFAARYFGFNQENIRISIYSGLQGGIYHDAHAKSWPQPDLPNIEDVLEFLYQRIICLQCGVAAEFFNKEDSSFDIESIDYANSDTAKNDSTQIFTYTNIARGIRFAGDVSRDNEFKQHEEILNDCWSRTKQIIIDNFPIIDAMSKMMADELALCDYRNNFQIHELLEFLNIALAQKNECTQN